MAHTVNVNFKLDEDVKKRMERACTEFEVSADPFYSESNLRHLESVMQDVKAGKARFAEHDLIEVD